MSTAKISVRQIKAARALLGWSQEQMAAQAGVSVPIIHRLESAAGPFGDRPDAADTIVTGKIIKALETGGIEFMNDDRPGVRLASAAADQALAPDELNASNDE